MNPSVKAYSSGPTVLVNRIGQEIGLEPLLNSLLSWNQDRCKLSPGTRLKALIINVLCGKEPLYQVKRFYQDQDVEWLFGPGVTANELNDNVLARALNKLHEATP